MPRLLRRARRFPALEAPVWQLAWAGVAQVRSRVAGGRAASCLTWGGGVPSFPFPNSGADLSAFPRWRFGRKAPRTWEVGEHQLLPPRSGGTPGPRLCSEFLNSDSGRADSFSNSGQRGSHSEPRLRLPSFAGTQQTAASPTHTTRLGFPSPI